MRKFAAFIIVTLLPAIAMADAVIKNPAAPPQNETELMERLQREPAQALGHSVAVQNAIKNADTKKYFWGIRVQSGEVNFVSKNGDCFILHEHYPYTVKDAGWDFKACPEKDGWHITEK